MRPISFGSLVWPLDNYSQLAALKSEKKIAPEPRKKVGGGSIVS
jgi:hypothetical protein